MIGRSAKKTQAVRMHNLRLKPVRKGARAWKSAKIPKSAWFLLKGTDESLYSKHTFTTLIERFASLCF